MKKLMILAAVGMISALSHAATVGWSLAGATSFANDAYQFFVIGENGVSSVATITALLDAGTSTADYAFGSGSVAANGTANVTAAASGKTLDAGTYESFFVVFDTSSIKAGESNYAVISGAANLSKTISATTANVTFVGGNQASFLNNESNWKSYGSATPTPGPGPIPEPTSGLLLVVGGAMLALRRKQK